MEIKLKEIEIAEIAAIVWLCNAYQHGKGGFPHSRWMFLPASLAWNSDYAETTGYLIENLLEFKADAKPGLSQIAETAGNWLLSVQSAEGYFHSGTKFSKPSAFNTAQVLFGLDILYKHTKEKEYFDALSKAFHWLTASIDDEGKLIRGLYVDGFYSAYYSRAIWPLMKLDKKYFNSKNEIKLSKSLEHLFSHKNEFGFFNNAGFYPGKPSLLHTVAYTLEGFYECSKLAKLDHINVFILQILDHLCELIRHHQKTPAYLYSDFKPEFSFICVSGQAQICSLLLKVYIDNGNAGYKETATLLFKQLLNWQIASNSVEHNGAFPSSIPIWKNYFPFRYTNWTMKFFLDACALMKRAVAI